MGVLARFPYFIWRVSVCAFGRGSAGARAATALGDDGRALLARI